MSVPSLAVAIDPERVVSKIMDGEAVIIDLTTGTYYSLIHAGARAWDLLIAGHSVAAVAAAVAREYGIARERVTTDVEALVGQLVNEGLVRPVDEAPAADSADASVPVETAAGSYEAPVLQIYRDMQDLLALDPPMPGLKDIPWT